MTSQNVSIALAMLMLCACAAAGVSAQSGAEPESIAAAPLDPVVRVADLLARADQLAADPNQTAALRPILRALDRLGAKFAVDGGEDPVASWRPSPETGDNDIPFRGRALGPAYRAGLLDGNASLAIDQIFLAGESAKIAVRTSDNQPIEFSVTGPDAKNYCEKRTGDRAQCQWLALYTQRYRIALRNPGTARLRYYLVTN